MRHALFRGLVIVPVLLALACGERTREVSSFHAPVFTSEGEAIRYVRLTVEESKWARLPIGERRPRWRSARAVVETIPVEGGEPTAGAVIWTASGDSVPFLETVWQMEDAEGVTVGLCLYDPESGTVGRRRLRLLPDGSRVVAETAYPPRPGSCPTQQDIDLYQPLVFQDLRREEVLAPTPDRHEYPRTAGIVLYDWRRRSLNVLLAPPEPFRLSPALVRHKLEGSNTPLRWRRRPAEALAAVERWVPENAHPHLPTVSDAMAYRMRHSAWTWWAPEWIREYRGAESWKITARFTRLRLDGRSQRFTAAWLVRFNDPHGPEVTAMGPNARRLSRLTPEETAGMENPGDPAAIVVDDRAVSVNWSRGHTALEPGDRVEVRLYCGTTYLGARSVWVDAEGTATPVVVFGRDAHPCGSRYHWSGPWILRTGEDAEGDSDASGRFVLDSDDAFVFLPS